MKLWSVRIIPILMCFALAISGCEDLGRTSIKHVETNDLIIPVNITEVLKHSEAEVIEYFQERREDLEALGGYMLENERVFQTRPVILHSDSAIDTIQDPNIQLFAQRLFQEGMVKRISSLNDDPSKQIDILIDDLHGLYQQGITYLSLPELLENDPSILSYVKDYKDLGGGWYYYVYHYDRIKEEDQYRDLAWDYLDDKTRNTLTTSKEKAIVTLEARANVGQWIDNMQPEVVVSVRFNTEMDGLLGPITMFFDPSTKELVGSNPRY